MTAYRGVSAADLAAVQAEIDALGSPISPTTADAALVVNHAGTDWVEALLKDANVDPLAAIEAKKLLQVVRTPSTRWLSPMGSASTLTLVADKLYAIPVDLNDPQTLTAVSLEITSAGSAGSVVRLGVYADDGTGVPGSLIVDAGTIDGTILYATTPGQLVISKLRSVERVYLCAAGQGSPATQPTVRSINSNVVGVTRGGSTPPGTAHAGYQENGAATTGALPDPFPAFNTTSNAARTCVKT